MNMHSETDPAVRGPLLCVALGVLLGACTGGATSIDTAASGAGAHDIHTVFVIVMENHNWSDILGSSSAPYINDTLLPMASYTSNYYDNPDDVHPSEPNYIWIEAGDNLGITSDSSPSASHSLSTTDHLVTQLDDAGVDWRVYAEDMPEGTCPISTSGLYAPKHDATLFFQDVSGDPPSSDDSYCIQHHGPYSALQDDLQQGNVAQYDFIIPNLCDDMHNWSGCDDPNSMVNGDTWLSQEVPHILDSSAYKDGGALFITWDESEMGEKPIGMIVLSPLAKGGGYVSDTKYYHSSLLGTVETIFGVPKLRDAQNQPDLSDLFATFP